LRPELREELPNLRIDLANVSGRNMTRQDSNEHLCPVGARDQSSG
jgi:hypothetical protein